MANPTSTDTEYTLWRKIALNWYNYAFAQGFTSINPPSPNDTVFDLQRKITYATAILAT